MMSSDTKMETGKTLFSELSGMSAHTFIDSFSDISPDFARRALEWEFGDVMANTSLDRRLQEAVAVATFATLGATASPILKFRISTALRAGLTKIEIVDILNQVSLGAGLPVGVAALRVAEEVFGNKIG